MAESNPPPAPTSSDEAKTDQKDDDSQQTVMDILQQQLKNLCWDSGGGEGEETPEQLLEEISIDGVAKYMLSERCKNVVILCGAGVSTAAGIPDFRSPETGLYHNLEKYKLPYPQAIFELAYFLEKPEPFFSLAKELYPGRFNPTTTHLFIKLLENKNLLHRLYTQNIDTLERCADINPDKIVEAHGTFYSSHCTECNKEYTKEWMKEIIFSDALVPRCTVCDGLVKPDIIFFGEKLPDRFAECSKTDFDECDLLIIMGTSLNVQPFASLPGRVSKTTPRLLINLEKAGESNPFFSIMGLGDGLDFSEKTYRDVFWKGNCDDGCQKLASLLGWEDDFNALISPPIVASTAQSTKTTSPQKNILKKKLLKF